MSAPAMPTAPQRLALRGDLLDFTAAPALDDPHSPAVRWRPDHWLLIEGERIAAVLPPEQAPGGDWQRIDHRGRLILPGFIDTHVHCPQLDVIASYGTSLLDWLDTYTFPAERRFADPAVAQAGAELFLDALAVHGTTSAVVFPTVHAVSSEALLASAARRGMRLITGKVLMDRHAPDGLRDDVVSARADCLTQIERWHGQGRLAYALTVRFAPTSTPAQLTMAGELLRTTPGAYMQTHVAENQDEVRWVAELFPEARSYLDVYHRFGLLNERAVLAHGIWLDAADRALLRDTGAHIAHCPTSNLFLGSGLFDWRAAVESGFGVSMATDVGGGTSLSMQRTLAEAYKVQALRGQRLSAWAALHAATRGAAQALRLGDEIGGLNPGQFADLAVWDWAHGPVATHRDAVACGQVAPLPAQDLHARVFAWMTLSDERNLVQTWIAGCPQVAVAVSAATMPTGCTHPVRSMASPQ